MTEETPNVKAIIRDLSAPHHCKNISMEEIAAMLRDEKIKTMIIIPDNSINNAKNANGICKIPENILAEEAKNTQIICFYFPDNIASSTPKETHNLKKEKAEAKIIGNYIFNNCFLPIVADCPPERELNRISSNKAAMRMRSNQIFTHNFGGYIAETIDKNFNKALKDLGYWDSEKEYICKQVLVIDNNNVSEDLGKIPMLLTHLERLCQSDKIHNELHYMPTAIHEYIKNEPLADDEVLFIPLANNTAILLCKQSSKDDIDKHNDSQKEENKTPAGKKEEKIANGIIKHTNKSKKPIEDLEHLAYDAQQQDAMGIKYEDLTAIVEYGKEYADDYRQYCRKTSQRISDAMNRHH